jgi:hypothetical protein
MSRRALRTRSREYELSLTQWARLLPRDGWRVIFIDNTMTSYQQFLDTNSGRIVSSQGWEIHLTFSNEGTINKGLGELEMLLSVCGGLAPNVGSFSTVTYYTARQVLTSRFLIDQISSLRHDAIIANPDFVYLDGAIVRSRQGDMFNDMTFTMRGPVFEEFVNFTKAQISRLREDGVASEQNLFNFVKSKQLDYTHTDHLGLLRADRRGHRFWRGRRRWHLV